MPLESRSRRSFLLNAGAASLCTLLFGPACTLRSAPQGRAWPEAEPEYFTVQQMAILSAVADRILPPGDGFPGAGALGAARFIDRAVIRIIPEDGPEFLKGIEALVAKSTELHPDTRSFLDLTPARQDRILHALEGEPFFALFRGYVIYSCFTLPEHGGNRDAAGWELMGFEHRSVHEPPFGHYDRDYSEPEAPEPEKDIAPSPPPPGEHRRLKPTDPVDFIVVGAGAAGGAIAWELARAGLNVVLLEQGPYLTERDFTHDEIAVLVQNQLTNHPDLQPQTFRESADAQPSVGRHLTYGRAVGGGTLHFTANYWRFRPGDFNERSVIGAIDGTMLADWPISYEELEPYYTRAEYVLGVSGLAGAHPFEPPRSAPYPLPPLPVKSSGVLFERGARALGWHPFPAPMAVLSQPHRGRPACRHCGFCQGFGCEWGAKSSSMASVIREAERTGNCEVRPHSYVRKIQVDARGRATGVVYFDKDRREIFQQARAVVVSANGAETPRLLLMSRFNQFPDGLANSSGMVGKCLMFNTGTRAGGVFRHRLNDWKSVQPSRVLWDFYDSDPARGFYGGGGLDARFGPLAPADFADDLRFQVQPAWGAEYRRQVAHRFSRTMAVDTHGTSLPLITNAVDLDPELTDDWGLPALRTTYRDHPDDLACTDFLGTHAEALLRAAGAVETSRSPARERRFSEHLLGTCRMGDDPRTSVIDRNHRTHDVPNLFLCDGSSFVTSGRGQPTCTISALGFRAGELMAKAARRGDV